MTNPMDRATRSLAFALPALLLLFQTAVAQAAAPVAPEGKTIVVKGARDAGSDPRNVIAGKSRILSRSYASSCAFMTPGNSAEEAITLAYMRDFGLEDSDSFGIEHFSEVSPDGDVSNARLSSTLDGFIPSTVSAFDPPRIPCGAADRRFAAGRNHILRNDKSLAQAFEAFDNKDHARAFALFNTAYSKIGYPEAGLMLAKMHLYGMGTGQDTNEAIRWLVRVADERFDPTFDRMRFDPRNPSVMSERVDAAFTLARMYERGLFGTRRDPAQAKKWYAKAAEFGFVPALNLLGQAWLNGFGGEKSATRALGYFKEAADAGYSTAQYNLGKLYYNGDDGVPRDLRLAGAYFEAAARVGHPGALFAAGRMYDLGEVVAADQKKAMVYYKEAAVRGDPDAQFALGTYFYDGDQVPKDLATARKLFDVAATQGQVDAMFNVGAMQVNGEGGPRDLGLGYVWLSLAKTSGHQQAADALRAVAPKLTARDQAKADAILRPKAKS
jgi:TPR repeat protein